MLPHLTGGTGRPLLALHGNFASKAWWTALAADPPPGWCVVAPDLPGFGDAPPLHPADVPSIRGYADAVLDFVHALRLDAPVLLGHSLGGAVALDLAARLPGRFAGLVLAAGAPAGGLKTPEENYPVLELLRTDEALREATLAALFPSGRPAHFADLVRDAGRMDPRGYGGNARALERWSVEERPPGPPVLVLGGELDRLVTPDMTRRMARALGAREHVFAGRGHGFPQEDPAGFRAELDSFLDAVHGTPVLVEEA